MIIIFYEPKKFNLQIPINVETKQKASEEAKKQAFKSLQDVIRFLITKLANKQINIGIVEEKLEYITEKEEKILDKINTTILKDLKKG